MVDVLKSIKVIWKIMYVQFTFFRFVLLLHCHHQMQLCVSGLMGKHYISYVPCVAKKISTIDGAGQTVT